MTQISVITPSYNCSSYISETIESVLSQSLTDWEMILIDDCSSDNSVEMIESFLVRDSRIKLIRLSENSGAAAARNKAIDVAEGRYIAFLDSDDIWLPDKLSKQLDFMRSNDLPFVFSAYEKIDFSGNVFGHVGVPKKVSYSDLLKVCSIGCLTAIYDTHYFGKVYMPLIRKRQDMGLWLRLLKKTEYAYGLNEVTAQYRVHPDSISANKSNAAQYTWRLYREIEGLNLVKASYYFTHYAFRGLLRTKAPKIARWLGLLN